jgi:hypothetical protein
MAKVQNHYEPVEMSRRGSEDSDDPVAGLLTDRHSIVTKAPESRFMLGYGSVMGLVVNRMIGMLSTLL